MGASYWSMVADNMVDLVVSGHDRAAPPGWASPAAALAVMDSIGSDPGAPGWALWRQPSVRLSRRCWSSPYPCGSLAMAFGARLSHTAPRARVPLLAAG
jgi:hypothetical protein